MSVLVSGSVAIDNVKTQKASQENLLGGSASYAAIAASFFSPVGMVAVVPASAEHKALDVLRTAGHRARTIGKVVKGTGVVQFSD